VPTNISVGDFHFPYSGHFSHFSIKEQLTMATLMASLSSDEEKDLVDESEEEADEVDHDFEFGGMLVRNLTILRVAHSPYCSFLMFSLLDNSTGRRWRSSFNIEPQSTGMVVSNCAR
jgi:hypothetical protein